MSAKVNPTLTAHESSTIEKFAAMLIKLAGFYTGDDFDWSRRDEANRLMDEAFYIGYPFLDYTLNQIDEYGSHVCQAIADNGDMVNWENCQCALDDLKYMRVVNDRKVANGF